MTHETSWRDLIAGTSTGETSWDAMIWKDRSACGDDILEEEILDSIKYAPYDIRHPLPSFYQDNHRYISWRLFVLEMSKMLWVRNMCTWWIEYYKMMLPEVYHFADTATLEEIQALRDVTRWLYQHHRLKIPAGNLTGTCGYFMTIRRNDDYYTVMETLLGMAQQNDTKERLRMALFGAQMPCGKKPREAAFGKYIEEWLPPVRDATQNKTEHKEFPREWPVFDFRYKPPLHEQKLYPEGFRDPPRE